MVSNKKREIIAATIKEATTKEEKGNMPAFTGNMSKCSINLMKHISPVRHAHSLQLYVYK